MNSIPYKIYSGAGNDFVMINNIEGIIPFEMQKDFTIKICNEQFHQIDGVIFLEKPPNKNNFIRMNYYNRDGSYGAMCGNGARCISQFALDERILRINNFSIEAVNKIYKAEIKTNNVIKIFFPPPKIYKLNIPVYEKVHNFSLQVHYMDLGSEHLILFIDDEPNKTSFSISDLDNAKIDSWGRALRYHSQFEPFGANVNFIDVLESNKLRVRTYERGVERETLACGTGVISSALVSSLIGKTNPPVKVLAQSGEWLTVDFILNNNSIENLSLEGPAKKIGEGILKN